MGGCRWSGIPATRVPAATLRTGCWAPGKTTPPTTSPANRTRSARWPTGAARQAGPGPSGTPSCRRRRTVPTARQWSGPSGTPWTRACPASRTSCSSQSRAGQPSQSWLPRLAKRVRGEYPIMVCGPAKEMVGCRRRLSTGPPTFLGVSTVHVHQPNSVAQAGSLPVPDMSRKVPMTRLNTAENRLRQARNVPSALDAACDAFEDILGVIGSYEETATDTQTAIVFLLVATQAANGRDALLFAPSLPRRGLHPRPALGPPERGSASDITAAVTGLSRLLASC